mmetsp:Transcript_30538/g.46855  ORF Transcript_30538/g.46855 Transcript_30538/m.46855 type:complete len:314 (+) Transcript_30538:50-991(+)
MTDTPLHRCHTAKDAPPKLTGLFFAKALNVSILGVAAIASWLFVSPLSPHGLYYVLNGFLVTEITVVGTAMFFDQFETILYPYKIRKNHVASESLIEQSIWERIYKYRTEWITYTLTWVLSDMSFEKQTYAGIWLSMFQVIILCILLDGYVYFVHWWMHTRQGHFCHKKHHSFRYVNCWFVDHETKLESFLIAVGKHGALVYFSPHPDTALQYLFVTKLWNVTAHCGYNLPIFVFVDRYIPFLGTPNRHEQHHYHGDGNLSIFTTVFDYICGSLVWTDDEASQWRRDRIHSGKKKASSFERWKFDPKSVIPED